MHAKTENVSTYREDNLISTEMPVKVEHTKMARKPCLTKRQACLANKVLMFMFSQAVQLRARLQASGHG